MSVLKTYGADTESFKPSRTWKVANGHIQGQIDGLEAVKQAIRLILSTERFAYIIFSPDYGMEWLGLIGKDRAFVKADAPRRIEEALAEDDRITGISDFDIVFHREEAHVAFTVHTIFGDVGIERSVEIA